VYATDVAKTPLADALMLSVAFFSSIQSPAGNDTDPTTVFAAGSKMVTRDPPEGRRGFSEVVARQVVAGSGIRHERALALPRSDDRLGSGCGHAVRDDGLGL